MSDTLSETLPIDCEVPGKIAVRFLRTGRFLAVSIRVSRFLLGCHLQKPCGFLQFSNQNSLIFETQSDFG